MHGFAQRFAVVIGVVAMSNIACADFIVEYTADAGGINSFGIDGLSARSTWSISGTQLTIRLENTSTNVPLGFEISDSLLVSLAFNLGQTSILNGESAVIGIDSFGLGAWAGLGVGDSVGEEWLWTNDSGGDLLLDFSQVLSTSMGQGGGLRTDFNGNPADVSGPFGGITSADSPLFMPDSQRAVSNSILFSLTLSQTLSELDLKFLARSSIVEFGSDFQYMAVPSPGMIPILLGGLVLGRNSRRRNA